MNKALTNKEKQQAILGDQLLDDFAPYLMNRIMGRYNDCLLYTSPSPRDRQKSRMPSSA